MSMATTASIGQRTGPKQLVIDWLIERIRSGQLRPGDRIPPETQLCEALGVSRSSVREAVQRLAAANLLDVRHGAGTYVRAATAAAVLESFDLVRLLAPHNVMDLIEVREMLEAGMVALAAERATPEDLRAIQEVLEVNERAVRGDGSPVDADEQFHLVLALATHNAAMADLIHFLNRLFRHSREQTSLAPGANQRAYQAHVEVFQAIQARDSERARRAMLGNMDELRHHVVVQAQDVLRKAQARGAGYRQSAALAGPEG
jgi:GntR family transcriptional regulator, transcriptional repressor for pyruvate dehydrogenase complex